MGKWYQNLKVFEPWQWLIAFSAPILMMDWLRGLAECDELKNNTNGKLKIFSLLTEQKWHEAAFRTTWRWCMNSMLQVWLAKYCKHSTYSLQWCTQDVLGAGAKTIKMAPHVWWGGGAPACMKLWYIYSEEMALYHVLSSLRASKRTFLWHLFQHGGIRGD